MAMHTVNIFSVSSRLQVATSSTSTGTTSSSATLRLHGYKMYPAYRKSAYPGRQMGIPQGR
eukprot:1990429-Rhodomonas_salina.2